MLTWSEEAGDLELGGFGFGVDRLFELATLWGEVNDPGAAVDGVGLTGEVSVLFEVAEEVVDRLLGDLELVGESGGALPVEGGVAERSDVRGVEIVVAGREDA